MASPEQRKRAFVLIACMGVMFMTAVEGTITATAMPTVASALGGYGLFEWTFAAYLLAQSTVIPIYGRLADLHGRKPMFFIGATLFIAGSALCGAAPTMLVLIAGRAVQGFGAGGIVPMAQTMLADIFTPAERARVQGYLSSMWGISAIIGPMLGAVIVQRLSWPLIFWFNIPLALAVVALIAALFHETGKRASHTLDVLGAVLLILAVGGTMLALMQADHLGAWLVPVIATALVAGTLFAVHERRTPEPLLPFSLWKDPILRTCNLGALAIGASSMTVTVFVPTFIQAVMGGSPYNAGTTLALMSISWPTSSAIAARVMLRTSYRTSALIGASVLAVGIGMLALLRPEYGTLWISVTTFTIGIALGFLNSPFFVAAQDVAAWHTRGIVTAAMSFNRMLGAALGTAILGAAMNMSLAHSAPALADPIQLLVDPMRRGSLSADTHRELTAAAASALHVSFTVALGIVVLAAVAALGMPRGRRPEHTPRERPADQSVA